ncbi:MAG TPA: redoxin domain-containing protein [Thermomicrobiales bacterium]|jgi:cytochrome c biogenesis protein CcmG/thiol:disulfide interchange protein DsbE
MADVSAGELRTTEALANTPAPWRQRRWLLLAVIVGAVALLGLLYWGMVRGPSTQVGKSVPLKGPAQDFSVTTLDGQTLKLSDLRGKVVVLNVWASWCIPCQDEAGELNRSYDLYKGRDVAFVGIAFNDDTDPMRQFVNRYNVAYPVALDPEGRISIGLGITGVPETYLIDPQGNLTQKWVGPITAKQLNGLLAPMVP